MRRAAGLAPIGATDGAERRGGAWRPARAVGTAACMSMAATPFPARPCDVSALGVLEFTANLEPRDAASLDVVCRHFLEDANRAVVWLIRFHALTTWCEHIDVAPWLRSSPARTDRACDLAASFDLNDAWEFDVERFRRAVDSSAR